MPLSKTAALKKARRHVGDIDRRSHTEYVFFTPYTEPGGPTHEVRANSYWQAREERARSVARVALALMDAESTDLGADPIEWEIERAQSYRGLKSARAILDHVLREMERSKP